MKRSARRRCLHKDSTICRMQWTTFSRMCRQLTCPVRSRPNPWAICTCAYTHMLSQKRWVVNVYGGQHWHTTNLLQQSMMLPYLYHDTKRVTTWTSYVLIRILMCDTLPRTITCGLRQVGTIGIRQVEFGYHWHHDIGLCTPIRSA